MIQTASLRHLGVLTSAMLAIASHVGAQTSANSTNTTPATKNDQATGNWNPADISTSPWLATQYEHDFSANLKNGPTGSLNVNTYQLAAGKGFNFGDRSRNHLETDIGFGYTNYNFTGTGPVPFQNVQSLGFLAHYAYDYSATIQIFAHINAGFSADTSRTITSGSQYAIAVGPTWLASPDLTISFGPMFYSRIEDQDTWTPYADVKWTPADNWVVKGYLGVSNGASVAYDFSGKHATVLTLSAEYNSRWFRVKDTATGLHQAVDETGTTIKLALRQALCEHAFGEVFVDGLFGREYQLHTNGNSSSSFDVSSTTGIGLAIGCSF